MTRTLTVVKQYLAAAFVIAIGLMASGCGDSATVNPVVELASLGVDPGTLQPAFSGGTTQYRVDVTTDITTVTVTAQPAVAGDTVTINGQATTSRVITLDPPGSTTVVNIVVSETDTNSRTYVVRVIRAGLAGNNSLASLTVSQGTLAPAFDPNVQVYTVDVANNVGSIAVTPTLSDPAATMTVNGQPTGSGQAQTITLSPPGQSTNIPIVVTAQNGNPKSYQVTVSRGVSANNNLQSLTVSPGNLNPTFSANRTSYTVNVSSGTTSVTVTPRAQDASATMTVNGQSTNSGQARTIQLGGSGSNTPIIIVVTAQNGTQKVYTVGIERAALGGNNNLSALTVSPGTLNPAFNANTLSYTVGVASGVTSVSVTPTRQDPNATLTVTSNGPGPITTSGQTRTIPLRDAGLSTIINIAVRAPNGNEKPYTITVDRATPPPPSGNNNLSALTVRLSTSSPNLINFSPNTTSYTVDVVSTVTSVRVTPTLEDPAATLTVTSNGQVATSGQTRIITLRDAGFTTTINIVVRAPNGSEKPYTITVDRAAPPPPSGNNNLQSLTISPGTLTPPFSATRTRTDYAVNDISSSATAITVTASPQDSNATVTINDVAGNSRSIPLPTGPSTTEIEVRVIAPNNSEKRYFITVNQPAPAQPPAPASAPDLIPEDDSCPRDTVTNECLPGTSDADNITNVNTPRFRIAQPGAGETPSLHVDGNKVDSTFNQAANTLQPTAALSDGDHEITYTVSNAGGESLQSPSLTVTIDTVAPGGP